MAHTGGSLVHTDRMGRWRRGLGGLTLVGLLVASIGFGPSAAPPPRFTKGLLLGPTAEWRFAPLVVDLNGDGAPDLVATARLTTSALHLWWGQGRAFTPVTPPGTDIGYAAVATADLNHDGAPDLVLASHMGPVQTLLSDGHGGFTETLLPCADGAVAVALAELTGDSEWDLVRVGFHTAGLEIYRGDGHGHWTLHTRLPDPPPGRTMPGQALAVGDVNHDGHLDLVAAFNRWGLYLYTGDGRGGFTGGPVEVIAPRTFDSLGITLALADVNHDGHPDLVFNGTVGEPGQLHGPAVYLGDGQGGWKASSEGLNVLHGAAPRLAVGDVDQDGYVDLIAGGQVPGAPPADYGLFWFKGDGQGHWQLVPASGLPRQGVAIPHGIALVDRDRDGRPALLTLHGGSHGHLTLWARQ